LKDFKRTKIFNPRIPKTPQVLFTRLNDDDKNKSNII